MPTQETKTTVPEADGVSKLRESTRHEAGGAAQFSIPDSSATRCEKSAELKSSHENKALKVC